MPGRWTRPSAGVFGVLSLVALFAAILPLNAARVELAVQLQPARVFWMADLLATVYVVWALAEGLSPAPGRARRTAVLLAALSLARGGYVKAIEFPERPVAQVDIAANDWGRAMAWARSTDVRSGWLADPLHAVRYGTSVRVAGERDVFVEAVKDTAMGIYDRGTAMRTRTRLDVLGDVATLGGERARALAAAYGLDYLVVDRAMDLPLAFASGAIRIYRLR